MLRCILLSLSLSACSGQTTSATDDEPTDLEPVDTGGFEGPWVDTVDNQDGTFTTTVVAVSTVDTVYFSFETGEVAVGTTPPDAEWHLAFQREHILLNSSISGPGTVEAADLAGISFDAVRWAPVDGYAVDLPDDDADGEDEEVLYTWFVYDYDNHVLDPSDFTYVVRTPQGDVRMTVETYYNEADGNSGYPKFHWAWLQAGGPLSLDKGQLRVDASSETDAVHVSLREWVALEPGDAAASDDWDLAFLGSAVALNGGTSGPGGLSAASVAADFDAPIIVPGPKAFQADADGVPALGEAFVQEKGGGASPADLTWLISRPDGSTDKVRFDDFEDAGTAFGIPVLRWATLD